MSEIIKNKYNSENPLYEWNDIRRDVLNETPKETDFIDIYGAKSVEADLVKKAKIKERMGIREEFSITKSRIQEYATQQEIGEMDWFQEEKQVKKLFPDDKGHQTTVFLSSEFDDLVNHVDAIAIVENADSEFKPVPFAFDITYNTSTEKLDKKFSWPHPFLGKRGLATVKYFEDTFYGEDSSLPKGRIETLPRFVIGYSEALSYEITSLRKNGSDWNSLRREEFSTKAKWCVLKELKLQSEQMLAALSADHGTPELAKMLANVKALDAYFKDAIEASREADKNHPDWITYPDTDLVFQAITARNIM